MYDLCDRCRKETSITIMSMFNTDMICMDCLDKEEKRSDYKSAKEAEFDEVKKGNYNFKGVGY